MNMQKDKAPHLNAAFGEGTVKGEYCVIENGAKVGKSCVLGHHVVIRAGSVIGDNVRIDDFACIGKLPMKAALSVASAADAVEMNADSVPQAVIGDGSIIGTGAIIYAGAEIGRDVLIADLATVRENVAIGEKTIIGRGAAVENCCRVGARCKIETNAYITAHSVIEDDCFIAPCVVTTNDNSAGRGKGRRTFRGVTVKRGGRIGGGAVILPGKTIEADGFAAAGSVVTKDVPPGEIVAGNPASHLAVSTPGSEQSARNK